MYTFQVKQKDRSKILSAFHILIALILVLDLSHVRKDGTKDWLFFSAYLVGCVFLLTAGLFHKKLLPTLSRHLSVLLLESALTFCGAIYFWSKGVSLVAFSHGILAGVVILFWIYFKRRLDGEVIVVSEQNLILPGLSGDRVVEWYELTNVIKKYDLLSIDFKNNKLIQVQVIDADHVGEDEFNHFCQEQLAKPASPGK